LQYATAAGRGDEDLEISEQVVPDAVFGDAKKVLAQQQQV
jgi:hypothetical protein